MTARQRAWLLPPAVLFLVLGILLGRSTASPLLPYLACIPAVIAVFLLRGLWRFASCLVLCLTLGAAAGQSAWHPPLPAEREYEVRGIVSDEIRRGSYGQVRTALSEVSLNGRPLSSGAYWTFYTDADTLPDGLAPGREVVFTASLYHPSGADNPDGYDFREELLRRGIAVCVYGNDGLSVSAPSVLSFSGIAASLRDRLAKRLIALMGDEAGGYAAALLLGVRSLVPSEDRAAFAKLGIAHILSVSGFHTGVLVFLLSVLFRLLKLRQSVRLVLYSAFLLLYCALCGMSQPVLRASLLLLLALGGKLLNRPRIGLHLLCAAGMVMLLLSPVQLTGISFQLTFGAVLGITLVTPYLDSLCPFSRESFLHRIWSALAVMFGAQVGILLPELYYYQKLPLLSVLMNLPASIAATAVIALDWIILLLSPFPFICSLPAALGKMLTSWLLQVIRAVGALPGISLWTHASTWLTLLGLIPVFFSLCHLFRMKRWIRGLSLAVGLSVVCFSLIPPSHGGTEYIQFSVGNADGAVLWDEKTVYVLDTGSDDGVVSGFLRRNRLTPDAVILTHLHTDHAGGLKSLLEDEIPIRILYLPAGAEDQEIHDDIRALLDHCRTSGTEIRTLARGDTLSLPSGSLTVLWPEAGKTRLHQDANDYSLVFLLSLHGISLLQTGDLEGLYESYAAVPADLLKAAHHGSASSSSAAFLSAVNPQGILLSCRSSSRHEDFAERAGTVPVWSTAASGALTVHFSKGAFTVDSFLPDPDTGGLKNGP